MLDWGASDFGTDLGRCHFIGAVQNEEESIKVNRCPLVKHENRKMQWKFCRQMTLTAAPGSIPGKNHGLRLILDAEVNIFCATSEVKTGFRCFIFWYNFQTCSSSLLTLVSGVRHWPRQGREWGVHDRAVLLERLPHHGPCWHWDKGGGDGNKCRNQKIIT